VSQNVTSQKTVRIKPISRTNLWQALCVLVIGGHFIYYIETGDPPASSYSLVKKRAKFG
jgi:hypothetical protein